MSVIDPKQESDITWPEWVDQDLRNPENKALAKYKDQKEALKGYVSLSRKMGSAVFKPGEGATEEQLASWRKAIGVPEKPEEFGLKADEFDGFNPETLETIQGSAFKHGLPANGLKSVLKEVNERAKAQAEAFKKQIAEKEKAYEEMVRTNAGADYEEIQKRVSSQFEKDPELDDYAKQVLRETGLASHPFIVNALDHRAKNAKGHSFQSGKPPSPPSINEIQNEINKLSRTPEYMNKIHPGHSTAMNRMKDLINTKLELKNQASA